MATEMYNRKRLVGKNKQNKVQKTGLFYQRLFYLVFMSILNRFKGYFQVYENPRFNELVVLICTELDN